MFRCALCIFFIVCLTSVSALADYVEVRRAATVYVDSDKTSAAIFKPPTGAVLILLETDTKNGYYHVQDDATGQSGWIYKTLVRRHPGAPSAAPASGTPPAAGGIPTGGFPANKCASPYNEESSAPTPFDQSCGLSGSAALGSGELPQDISKNDLCEKSAAIPVKTADLVELQNLVDATGMIYGSKFSGKGPPKERTILHNLANLQNGVKLEEDDVVTYVGFLVEAHYMPQ